MKPASTGRPWTTWAFTSKVARFGSTQYSPRASCAANGDWTTCSKFRRSALKWPATHSAKVKAAERIGGENVEKNNAMAVTTDSSTTISATAFRIRGSEGGTSHVATKSAGNCHAT